MDLLSRVAVPAMLGLLVWSLWIATRDVGGLDGLLAIQLRQFMPRQRHRLEELGKAPQHFVRRALAITHQQRAHRIDCEDRNHLPTALGEVPPQAGAKRLAVRKPRQMIALHRSLRRTDGTVCGIQAIQPLGHIGGQRGFRLDHVPGNRGEQIQLAEQLVDAWVPFSVALNSVHRSLGMPDLYPFILTPAVVAKLEFIHGVVRGEI